MCRLQAFWEAIIISWSKPPLLNCLEEGEGGRGKLEEECKRRLEGKRVYIEGQKNPPGFFSLSRLFDNRHWGDSLSLVAQSNLRMHNTYRALPQVVIFE